MRIAQVATRFIVEGLEDAIRAAERISSIDRARRRQVFEERFSASRMAHDYVEIYHRLANDRISAKPRGWGAAAG